ncbi:formate dehydrogenase subunit gamma [uncultured Methylovirgula sp.]|uniref:formate dehydrogenase subunit gamma n=1 Tax=uncultured Methylovirgula sp. TaxID=1285960 RepID=UPI00262BEACF|nr:formate dehydrogenase subunit gamma [uncultured Methylovirgula sp.]
MPAVFDAQRAKDIIDAHLALEGPLLPILHAFVEEFGFVDDAAVPQIADALNITRAEVHGVLTFYHDFRREPAGRHILKICRAEACQARGCESVADHCLADLGVDWHGTTADGAITVEPVYCLGLCANGPSALFDDEPIAELTADKLVGVIEEADAA